VGSSRAPDGADGITHEELHLAAYRIRHIGYLCVFYAVFSGVIGMVCGIENFSALTLGTSFDYFLDIFQCTAVIWRWWPSPNPKDPTDILYKTQGLLRSLLTTVCQFSMVILGSALVIDSLTMLSYEIEPAESQFVIEYQIVNATTAFLFGLFKGYVNLTLDCKIVHQDAISSLATSLLSVANILESKARIPKFDAYGGLVIGGGMVLQALVDMSHGNELRDTLCCIDNYASTGTILSSEETDDDDLSASEVGAAAPLAGSDNGQYGASDK